MVVSDSPHLVETHSSETSHSVFCSSVAQWTNSFALRETSMMVFRSPFCSIEKAATGLPVSAMPSAIFWVQPGSMPTTMQAATFGLEPVPIMVRK